MFTDPGCGTVGSSVIAPEQMREMKIGSRRHLVLSMQPLQPQHMNEGHPQRRPTDSWKVGYAIKHGK